MKSIQDVTKNPVIYFHAVPKPIIARRIVMARVNQAKRSMPAPILFLVPTTEQEPKLPGQIAERLAALHRSLPAISVCLPALFPVAGTWI